MMLEACLCGFQLTGCVCVYSISCPLSVCSLLLQAIQEPVHSDDLLGQCQAAVDIARPQHDHTLDPTPYPSREPSLFGAEPVSSGEMRMTLAVVCDSVARAKCSVHNHALSSIALILSPSIRPVSMLSELQPAAVRRMLAHAVSCAMVASSLISIAMPLAKPLP